MRYSTEPRHWIYVKGYGFLFFAKNLREILSSKYQEKLYDKTKNFELGLWAGIGMGFLGLGAGFGAGVDANGTMNTLSSCCLELFCELFWFLNW